MFTPWFRSERQATLRAIRVPQSPLGLGALVGVRHQVHVRRHVFLRGATHVHSSTVFGYAVVLSPSIFCYSLDPCPPQGGRGEVAMAWPRCMLHQTFSLSSVPVQFPVRGAASHNRWGVVETPLSLKTQGRNMDRSLSS